MRRVIALLNPAGVAPELRTPAREGLPKFKDFYLTRYTTKFTVFCFNGSMTYSSLKHKREN